ncbi:MAG: glycosyltransferase family 4 protein [Gammaproteobacteria bacterium]
MPDVRNLAFAFIGSFLLALTLTRVARRYAIRRALLDVPNARSSHLVPTPRGGGIAIAVTVIAAIVVLYLNSTIRGDFAAIVVVGGSAVALVGWIDDHRSLSIGIRAGVQFLSATLAVVILWMSRGHELFGSDPMLTMGAAAITVFGIVWGINFFNFLDGTDGYAGCEAVFTALVFSLVFMRAKDGGVSMFCLCIAGASAGFLVWNWAPAKIFMGDVGSCFLGYVFGLVALHGYIRGAAPAWFWVTILGVFFWDATLTLIRRMLAGEPWLSAHRTHAYQRLHQLGWSHARIALGAILVNVIVILPMAWAGLVWDTSMPFFAVGGLLLSGWLAVNLRYRALANSRN